MAAAVGGALTLVGAAASATTTATPVLGNLTRPAGGVWLPGGGGHFWVADNVLGLCEVVPSGTSFSTTNCQGTAKGGQAVFDPATNKVYVADNSSKTNQVLRYNYDPTTDRITGNTSLQIPDPAVTQARASSVALMTDSNNVQHLYVGYVKSGSVLSIANPATATSTPAVTKVGQTSDNRGMNALAAFTYTDNSGRRHDNLYLGENGGAGMSVIPDIDGSAGRPVCTSGCIATTVKDATGAVVSFLPGGLVADRTLLYVGDAPLTTPGKLIGFNPVTGASTVLSTSVPSYTSAFDGKSRNTYANISGLGLGLNGDVFVGDDPSSTVATPPNGQGHLWKVPGSASQPAITSISPSDGPQAGGTVVTISGSNLSSTLGATTVSFGTLPATGVSCAADGTTCTATSPQAPGAGPVDIRVTNGGGQTSPVVSADQYSYDAVAAAPGAPTVGGMTPSTGLTAGGTAVTITGTGLTNADGSVPAITFGTVAATSVSCADATSCVAVSPPGSGADPQQVNVQVTNASGNTVAGSFTYQNPKATVYSSGITAPKGGVTWVPDTIAGDGGGHYWVSDHANGFCRLDASLPAGATAGLGSHAVNVAACDPGFTVGSPGQAVYDPRANADGTHYIYVPDNAVKSPGVWRLTFAPSTATVSNPVAMAPGLMDNLKTNGLALDPAADALYVGDLVDGNIRRINGIIGDPRVQTVDIVAVTQAQKGGGTTAPSRGINGTMALLDGKLYLPENTAATYVDLSQPCAAVGTTSPCSTVSINFVAPSVKVFVAGVAADPIRHLVYVSESPGGANATIYRWDPSTVTSDNPGGGAGVVYLTAASPLAIPGGASAMVACSTTCTRPADPTWTNGATPPFAFAQGLFVDPRPASDPNSGTLYLTEDATAGARSGRGNVWSSPYLP